MPRVGTLQLGRITLGETTTPTADTSSATAASRTLQFAGQEGFPGQTVAQLAQLEDDLTGMAGDFVPASFTVRTNLNGFYQVADASGALINWNGELITLDWKTSLMRVGADTEIDIESRLTGATARNNSFSATGERWHAPPIGHHSYWTGSSQPTVITRTGADGAQTVYRGLPTTINPRWGCAVANYLKGRVRFTDSNGLERSGISNTMAATGWTLHNGLVQVTPMSSGGVLQVSAWTGGAWQAKAWDVQVNAATLGPPTAVSLLRNQPELVVLRLLWSQAAGRTTLDVTLRRGSRFVELYLQTSYSSALKVVRSAAEMGSSATGYVTATNDDSAGNRFIVGSSKTATADTTNGGLSVSAATAMDAFIGVVASQPVLNSNPDFETSLTPWAVTGGTLARSNTRAHNGSWSAQVTPDGVSAQAYITSEQVPVTAGASYQASAWSWFTNAVTANWSASINWFDSSHTYLSTTSSNISVGASAWTPATNTATAPVNAAFAQVVPTLSGTPAAGQVFWVDEVKIRAAVPSGDIAADLWAQYLGAPSELVQGVRR